MTAVAARTNRARLNNLPPADAVLYRFRAGAPMRPVSWCDSMRLSEGPSALYINYDSKSFRRQNVQFQNREEGVRDVYALHETFDGKSYLQQQPRHSPAPDALPHIFVPCKSYGSVVTAPQADRAFVVDIADTGLNPDGTKANQNYDLGKHSLQLLLFEPKNDGNPTFSDEFMMNARHEALHLRSYAPSDAAEIKAVVIFLHGYGGHNSAAPKVRLGLAMPPKGIAMVQMDLPGHGYSDGERAYIKHYSNWMDDYFQLLEAVAGGGFSSEESGSLNLSTNQLDRMKKVPFFLSGESLGGGLSILMGLMLQDRQHSLLPRFGGVGLIAPAIQGNPPPAPVVMVLRYLVAPLIPRKQIPDALETVKNPEKVWKAEADRERAKLDAWGTPGGIGWNHNMKFNMGLNMMDMVAVVYKRLSDVKFPFLIMHDPEDAIVQFSPSAELLEKASTPKDDPRARELKEMTGWLHDLLTNCPDLIIENLTDWIMYQAGRAS